MSEPTITITVQGPGGCFWAELTLIQQALENAGATVELVNNSPHLCQVSEADIKHHYADPLWNRVRLVAHHIPWGG